MQNKKTCFITSDFSVIDWEYDDFDRYIYPKVELSPEDYDDFQSFREWLGNDFCEAEDLEKYQKMSDEDLRNNLDMEYRDYLKDFEIWTEDNLDYEETHAIPMMNALYYYPEFISFDDIDEEYKKM